MPDEIKTQIEEATKLVVDIQAAHTALQEESKANSEEIDKMSKKFEELSTSIHDMNLKAEAEQKAREELELAMSRMGGVGKDGDYVGDREYQKMFHEFVKTNCTIPTEIQEKEFDYYVKAYNLGHVDGKHLDVLKTHMVGSGPDGGYFAPVQLVMEIVRRVFESSVVRQYANVMSISGQSVDIPISDDVLPTNQAGEVDTRTQTGTPKYGVINIPAHEQYAYPMITQMMLDDGIINMEQEISNEATIEFSRQENRQFMVGNSVKEAHGICDYDDWATLGQYERNALETRTLATAGTLDGDDFIDVQSDLLENYQGNSRWMMNRKIWATTVKLKDSQNQYLINPMMLFSGVQMQLLGRPVHFSPDMDSTVESDNILAIYGDIRAGYRVVDRLGMRLVRDNITTPGFVRYNFWKRTGGAVTNYQAIKRLRNSDET